MTALQFIIHHEALKVFRTQSLRNRYCANQMVPKGLRWGNVCFLQHYKIQLKMDPQFAQGSQKEKIISCMSTFFIVQFIYIF